MQTPASFGHWLKLRRKTMDLTQDALAGAVGCSVVTIRKLEADERRPSRQIAERLADCLRITADERAAFIGLARAEPSLDAAPVAAALPEVAPRRPRTNLPLPLTRLLGRAAEVNAVRSLLLRADTRLVTLSGPPGIGKTRLALEAAAELRDAFADGVCFVALASIRDPALVLAAIAHALELRESSGRPLAERVGEYLHDKRLLLVLDNVEHLVAAAPDVVAVLEAASGVKALVTSRAALRVRGEQIMQVAPLPLPEPGGTTSLRVLAHNPAVALFVSRAQAVQPAFVLTEANAPAVAALCTHLEGLPLAIELMAPRVKLLPPAGLLAALDRRLAAAPDGPRDLPARHQTLSAALSGSYELLNQDAQALFRQLGVFAGGWTLEAGAALWAGAAAHQPELLEVLAVLVEHSLVLPRPPSDAPPRFSMLETIREYAQEQLQERGEAIAAHEAHAAYFLGLAQQAAAHVHGPHQVHWLDRLEDEHANLRAALEWLLHTGDVEQALRLAGALGWFWHVRGYSSEGRRWLRRILDHPAHGETGAHTDRHDRTLERAAALHVAGHLALFQGDFAPARAYLERSVACWRALAMTSPADGHAQQGLIEALNFLFLCVQFQGDAARETILAEYVSLATASDDPRVRAMFLFNQGRGALLQAGEYAAAQTPLEQSLALLRPLGDLWYIANVVIDLGLVAVYHEQYEVAETWYTEGLSLARTLRDRTLTALALNNLGEVARCRDDWEQAAQCYTESLALHQQLGNQSEAPRLLHNLGYVALHRGDEIQAQAYFGESLRRFAQLGMTRGVAEALAGCAAVAAVAGQAGHAARLWGAAAALHAAEGTPVWPADHREQLLYQRSVRAQLGAAEWEAAWQQGWADPAAQQRALQSS